MSPPDTRLTAGSEGLVLGERFVATLSGEVGFPDQSPLFYKDKAEQADGRYRFMFDADCPFVRLTLGGETRPDGIESERAELWEKRRVIVPYGAGAWYGIRVRCVEPIPRDTGRHLLMQWKGDIPFGNVPNVSPFLALRLSQGRLFMTADAMTLPESGEGAAVWQRAKSGQSRVWLADDGRPPAARQKFDARSDAIQVETFGTPLPKVENGWIDFVFYARPGPRGDGRLEVVANGNRIVSARGRIGHEGLTPGAYFKFGPYRDAAVGEWSVDYADFRRGPRCLDVAGPKVASLFSDLV
ncbi:MAG: heparin lyase I family protein [Pseudomonadota bacterium]